MSSQYQKAQLYKSLFLEPGPVGYKLEPNKTVVYLLKEEQVKEIVFLDPSKRQFIPIVPGQGFYKMFPDEESANLALAAFKEAGRVDGSQ